MQELVLTIGYAHILMQINMAIFFLLHEPSINSLLPVISTDKRCSFCLVVEKVCNSHVIYTFWFTE